MTDIDRIATRFWAKVDASGDCWLWTGKIAAATKYGHFWRDGKTVLAHRVAYELCIGRIPAGLQLDHLCRVRHCVNPAHLEPVTTRENILRGESPSAKRARQTHCVHGHPFDEENTYRHGHYRVCRICKRLTWRRWAAKRAAL